MYIWAWFLPAYVKWFIVIIDRSEPRTFSPTHALKLSNLQWWLIAALSSGLLWSSHLLKEAEALIYLLVSHSYVSYSSFPPKSCPDSPLWPLSSDSTWLFQSQHLSLARAVSHGTKESRIHFRVEGQHWTRRQKT